MVFCFCFLMGSEACVGHPLSTHCPLSLEGEGRVPAGRIRSLHPSTPTCLVPSHAHLSLTCALGKSLLKPLSGTVSQWEGFFRVCPVSRVGLLGLLATCTTAQQGWPLQRERERERFAAGVCVCVCVWRTLPQGCRSRFGSRFRSLLGFYHPDHVAKTWLPSQKAASVWESARSLSRALCTL